MGVQKAVAVYATWYCARGWQLNVFLHACEEKPAAESALEVWWRIAISAEVGQPRLPAQGVRGEEVAGVEEGGRSAGEGAQGSSSWVVTR